MKAVLGGLSSRRVLGFGVSALVPTRAREASNLQNFDDHARLDRSPGTSEPEARDVSLGGVTVTLMSRERAVADIIAHAAQRCAYPLCVVSANLDHINHFGAGGKWQRTLEGHPSIEWLTLLDGRPLVKRANKVTQVRWPCLAGSDLIDPILDRASHHCLRIGFLGGSAETQKLVQLKFAQNRPNLLVVGWWAPESEEVDDPAASQTLCNQVRAADVDILVVCLGKPRQELWLARYGELTGARVLLAFGAAIDFLAGRVRRAPVALRRMGLEWAWRLMLEPRRLARRYLIQGPFAYRQLLLHSCVRDKSPKFMVAAQPSNASKLTPGVFSPVDQHTDVAVLLVTYNNHEDLPRLIRSLRVETSEQSIKVVVADNSPTPETLDTLAKECDVLAVSTGGNRGYSGGINAALARAGTADSFLILNPDLQLQAGSIMALRKRMNLSDAGVVVPQLFGTDGQTYPSLRYEPNVLRAAGDALMGGRIRKRSRRLTEMDFNPSSYRYPHEIAWATGAALLIRSDLIARIGHWDERFFLYSEEVDFFRRARHCGAKAWFEPEARMIHTGGGSGRSPELLALMAVNKIRYAEKYSSRSQVFLTRCIVAVGELARVGLPGHLQALRIVLNSKKWSGLPHANWYASPEEEPTSASGTVIIPAHNEAAVIARTLASLQPLIRCGGIEVIVACNGCTDNTANIAESFPGVTVIRVPEASKIAALNAADRAATRWPRIYLDADIDITDEALRCTMAALEPRTGLLAARPAFEYDVSGASWPVRAYYRARRRLASTSGSLWGAGVYGISYDGHKRFAEFPRVVADDLFINNLYEANEKSILPCRPVRVRTPRKAGDLRTTLLRVYRGNAEQKSMTRRGTKRTLSELIGSVHGPSSAFDAAVYACFAMSGRSNPCFNEENRWERDESSRLINLNDLEAGKEQS